MLRAMPGRPEYSDEQNSYAAIGLTDTPQSRNKRQLKNTARRSRSKRAGKSIHVDILANTGSAKAGIRSDDAPSTSFDVGKLSRCLD